MKRSRVIRLVLLGGGTAAMLAACGDEARLSCEQARAQLRPDAEQICRRSVSSSTGSGYYGGGWTKGRTTTDAGPSSVSRGGFGSSASSFSSGS